MSARSLASAIKSGEVGSLRLALSQTIDPSLVMPHVVELGKLFNGLELKLYRGNANDVLGYLKRGDAELGLGARSARNGSASIAWPLFTEDFQLVVNAMHRLANAGAVALAELQREALRRPQLLRVHAEDSSSFLRVAATSTSSAVTRPAPSPT